MSSSPIKDDEKAVAVAADEVELARMGYKQELKSVYTSVRQCRVLTYMSTPRRELGLMQVQHLRIPAGVPPFTPYPLELWRIVLDHQHHDWYTIVVPLRFGRFHACV